VRLRALLAAALPLLLLGCITVQTPNGPVRTLAPATTQVAGEISAVSAAVAPVIGVMPFGWSQIAGAALIGLSTVAGLIAHAKITQPTGKK